MTYEDSAISTNDLLAPPQQVFAFLDDPTVVEAHLQKRSLMMLGATMRYDVDAGNGQVVGSIVKMRGKVLGMELFV
ncbi:MULTISPECIES: hypothetical protein [unclassified Rhizobium]|uniref:hypothetical protein n=1 Tax=unclassified Rhizobium TaxID=2613769 RepID=UPI001620A92B|nr:MULTISPECIES: hypothetical protein [unclassified Rhizobium]MBB3545108.1 carbon monoxide dehydrogenase subunit G [Rhizobium sp. BK399]MCS3743867.1 carbon monoxide dehydrogenase subunit G [Rhizobium sp. BK661]MCS4095961.1 carbon monoxide dehydrogenase subunit G [Rhizobium sp. BK176]